TTRSQGQPMPLSSAAARRITRSVWSSGCGAASPQAPGSPRTMVSGSPCAAASEVSGATRPEVSGPVSSGVFTSSFCGFIGWSGAGIRRRSGQGPGSFGQAAAAAGAQVAVGQLRRGQGLGGVRGEGTELLVVGRKTSALPGDGRDRRLGQRQLDPDLRLVARTELH